MVRIDNLTNAQAMVCAQAMHARGRHALCNQIIVQVEARIEVLALTAKKAATPKPRKRVAKTGELK